MLEEVVRAKPGKHRLAWQIRDLPSVVEVGASWPEMKLCDRAASLTMLRNLLFAL